MPAKWFAADVIRYKTQNQTKKTVSPTGLEGLVWFCHLTLEASLKLHEDEHSSPVRYIALYVSFGQIATYTN